MKKLLSSLVLISILLTACFVGAMPASAAEVNYDDFDIYDGILVEYLGKEGGDVIIPAVDEDGEPVTEIDSQAFRYNEAITSVVIPEGVTKIGAQAFEYCSNLESVSMPSSLTEIGHSTFRMCSSLKSMTIPGGVKYVPNSFIAGCSTLTDLVISYGVEELGINALCNIAVERIVFPKSVHTIAGSTVSNCYLSKCEIVICNKDADIGYFKTSGENFDTYTYPFSSPKHIGTAFTIKVPAGSEAARLLKENTPVNSKVVEVDEEWLKEQPEYYSDFGFQPMINDADEPETEPDEQANKNDDVPKTDYTQVFITLGVIFGVIVLVIIAAAVIIIVTKKKQ